ncbi:MAG: MBL fold metallo-hydrolase [Planctomycetota bacterium]
MLISRRFFLGSAAGVAGAVGAVGAMGGLGTRALARASRPRPSSGLLWFTFTKLADGVFGSFGEGGNSLVIETKDGCVLVDSKNTGFGARLGVEVSLATGLPVRKLINTHHHYDHTGGNSAFVGVTDIETFAHPKAIARIAGNVERYKNAPAAAMKQLEKSDHDLAKDILENVKTVQASLDAAKTDAAIAKLFTPATPVDPTAGGKKGPIDYTWGGVNISIHHIGAGHTDNDIFIHLPKLNVIHTGDLLFNKVWPYMDRAGGCETLGWIASLKAILALCDAKTVVLPGHGEATDKAGVQRQIDFFSDMRAVATKAMSLNTTREDFLKLNPEAYKDYAPGIRQITLGGLWDEAKGVPAAKK